MSRDQPSGRVPSLTRRAVGFLALLVALAALPVAAGATARTGAGVELVRQTAWVPPDGDFEVVVDLSGSEPGWSAQATLHQRVSGRIQYERSTTGERLGSTISSSPETALDESTGTLATGDGWVVTREPGSRQVGFRLATRDEGPPDGDRLLLDDQGVYPLSVTLLDERGETVDQLVTHLVRLPEVGDRSPPLGLTLIVPVHAAPALRPGSGRAIDESALGDVRVAIEALADHPDVPLGVLATPETISALAAAPDGDAPVLLEQLRGALGTRQVMATTYVDVDPSSWVQAGLEPELSDQLSIGEDTVSELLGVRADRRTGVVVGGLTPDGLDALAQLGIDQLILDEAAVEPLDDGFGTALTQTFTLSNGSPGTGASAVQALTTDTEIGDALTATGDPVLDAHRVLADLSVLYFERPALPRGTALVLPTTGLSSEFADALLSALEQPAVVAPATPDTLIAATSRAHEEGEFVEDGPLLRRTLAPFRPPPLGSYPTRLRDSQAGVDGFRSLVGPANPQIDLLDEMLLVSGARSLTADEQAAYLDEVDRQVANAATGIVIEQQAVNLTQREGVIPIALRNDLDTAVTVTIRFESEKLEFPEGDSISQVLEPGVTAVTIPVRARASGAFPVDVLVTSPDGLLLGEGRFTVRSTAVSGLGIVLSILAALFLLLWWIRHFRQGRRERARARSEAEGEREPTPQ